MLYFEFENVLKFYNLWASSALTGQCSMCNIYSCVSYRVARVREKRLENYFFCRTGKAREFVNSQGNLEMNSKVNEYESILKIYLCNSNTCTFNLS